MFGIGPTELIIIFIPLILIGVAIVAILRALGGGAQQGSSGRGAGEARDAHQILDERYAQGEINREDYQRMRRDIEG